MTTAECVAVLEEADVVCSAINDVSAAATHPQVQALGILQGFPDSSRQQMVGSPLMVDGRRPGVRRRPPQLGQDTDPILAEAGFAQHEIDALRAAGAIAPRTNQSQATT
jgi:crotonobetainyl-CoA:carnitine CoA-transferase CaiB-like acyl-CoA transferase